jgi:hypothetical protein
MSPPLLHTDPVNVGWFKIASLHQAFQADQQGIAGKGRQGAIRGIPVSRRPQRQDLPKAMAAGREEINEAISFTSEAADPVGAGKGGRVKQDAAGAL